MKKIILLSVCLLIGAWTLRAQQTIYIIDNEIVENFDGSRTGPSGTTRLPRRVLGAMPLRFMPSLHRHQCFPSRGHSLP